MIGGRLGIGERNSWICLLLKNQLAKLLMSSSHEVGGNPLEYGLTDAKVRVFQGVSNQINQILPNVKQDEDREAKLN